MYHYWLFTVFISKTELQSHMLAWIRSHYKTLLLFLVCFGAFILFEARQQLFYALNFNNGQTPNVSFLEVLTGGLYRWLIWAVLAVPVVMYALRKPVRSMDIRQIVSYAGIILGTLFLNLVFITLNTIWRGGGTYSDFGSLLEFYFYHKAPIIFVALVFLTMLVHFFRNQEALELSIQEMGSLKYSNQQLYEQLKSEQMNDEAMVIQVKVGNRVKMVPLESIVWIEADDYCVRIHDDQGRAYTLRSTMKALEQRLPDQQFVRVHRKALVNQSEVKEYVFGNKPQVILHNGTQIPLAQSRIKEVRSLLQSV